MDNSLTKLAILVVIAVTPLSPGLGRAQTEAVTSAQTTEHDACLQDARCFELYENARSLSQAGQYEAALVAYQSAYARSKVAWLLVNIGRMYQKAGLPQQAITTYKRLLADPAIQQDPETQNKALEYLRHAEQEAEALKPRLLPASLAGVGQGSTLPPLTRVPIYKKWWFWTIIGGAVASGAIGLGVGLAAIQHPSLPPGINTYEPGF